MAELMRFGAAILLVLGAWPGTVTAQRAFDLTYGAWKSDSLSLLWSVGYRMPFAWPLDYTMSLSHLDDRRSDLNRTQTGGELTVGAWRDGAGPYAVASTGLGLTHQDGNFDASWSAGAGWAFPVLPVFSIAFEVRYRAEDQFSRGFWRLDPTDRTGVALMATARLGTGGRSRRPARPRVPEFAPPSRGAVEQASRDAGVSRPGSEMAAGVVETALQVMGTPYRWGGDGANGYDCSGLIQYAYGQHGIILPRVSREQGRMGLAVERRIGALRAGDILGFSVEGPGVTHVGLYIGEGQFIHSASAGVKLSSLSAGDPDSVWWQRRWVEVRRILQ